jgi:hypothetical protein
VGRSCLVFATLFRMIADADELPEDCGKARSVIDLRRGGLMNSTLNVLLNITLAVSALFASCAVGYYYLIYLPERDARLDAERKQERAQAEGQKRAQIEDQEAERRAQQQSEEAKRQRESLETQARYQLCLNRRIKPSPGLGAGAATQQSGFYGTDNILR